LSELAAAGAGSSSPLRQAHREILVLTILAAAYVSAAPRDDIKLLVQSNANLRESAAAIRGR
jgi:hypothetical protein